MALAIRLLSPYMPPVPLLVAVPFARQREGSPGTGAPASKRLTDCFSDSQFTRGVLNPAAAHEAECPCARPHVKVLL
jgi:hypothetical protein